MAATERFTVELKRINTTRKVFIRANHLGRQPCFALNAVPLSTADISAAVQFASEITAYLNKRHSLSMRFAVELLR
jgi:hypothetical protein